MKNDLCFLGGLKVFVLAVKLIDGDNRSGLSTLMKKQAD